jgi:6-phosphogluconolactonase
MARLALLDHVPIPPGQVHPVRGELEPRAGAADYEQVLRTYFAGGPPRFDLVLLGLGENGHTASLFPGTPVLKEKDRWAAEVYVAELDMWRVTLTAPCLNQAGTTAFLVSGAGKADVLRDVLEGPRRPELLPAQLIQPADGKLLWLADRPAAAHLKVVG